MRANQSLVACDSVLARLDAALETAKAEVTSAKAAEARLGALLLRVMLEERDRDSEMRISPPSGWRHRDLAANDNPAESSAFLPRACVEGRWNRYARDSA